MHTKLVDNIFNELSTSINGLSEKQVDNNRKIYGSNKLFEKKKKKWWHFFFEQYKDILMIVLLISSVISLIVSIIPQPDYEKPGSMLLTFEGWENFVLIVGVTLINAILGTVQSVKSQKSLESLKKLSAPKAKVIRNGETLVIDSSELVVGDIIIIEAGDLIPADARLFEVASLKVNESSLTGESEAILKNTDIINDEKIGIGDKLNCVFSGCLVVYGRAKAIVTAVGENTEIGKINKLLNETKDKKTPLQINLDRLAKFLMYIVLIVCLILFIVNIIKIGIIPGMNENGNWVIIFGDSLNFAVALAVAVIPEALSSIVTIVLTLSTKKMAKENAIVKELKAVEGLGSVSVICSDKTGTLTQNKMTVKGLYTNNKLFNETDDFTFNESFLNLPEMAVLCSDAKSKDGIMIGDPTEICLVEYYNNKNNDAEELRKKYKRISELPFDSERMMMSTLVNCNKEKIMITKGAIDKVLDKVVNIVIDNEVRKINNIDLKKINEMNKKFASEGKRVLCFAFKNMNKESLNFEDEEGLTFIGLMTMIDPPRIETIEAIKECKIGGIRPIMITGDHRETAVAIGKQIGIFNEGDLSLSGKELKEMSDEELAINVAKYSVYARVSPEDKIKIVRAWQKQNMIVSMTGDGVNDAPALKEANIGVAMGITGTEVSKDAASIILTDDNFATIISAVKSGRNIYNNIKSAVKFLLVGNLATIFISVILMIFGLVLKIEYVPFAAIQLLFLNLLTDSWPAISLGLESYKKDVIYEKPRKADEFFITKNFIKKVARDAILITIICLSCFLFSYFNSNLNPNLAYDQACSMTFITLSFCRLFHSFNCHSDKSILFNKELFSNYFIIGSFILGTILLCIIYYVPTLNSMFMHASVSLKDSPITPEYKNYAIWICLAFASADLLIYQIIQFLLDFKKVNTNRKINNYFKNNEKWLNKNHIKILIYINKNQNVNMQELKNAIYFNENELKELITIGYVGHDIDSNNYYIGNNLKFIFND